MPHIIVRRLLPALALLAAVPAPVSAEEKPTQAVAETEEEQKEREARRVCYAALCATFHDHEPGTGEVTCRLQKTWRKEALAKLMSRGKVTWPWGYARCATEIKLDRSTLIKSVTLPEFEAQFDKHEIRCELEAEKEKYEVLLEIKPNVTFKDGKAVKARLNWGKIEAPKLAKTALWPATAADNSFGVLQSILVEDINDFIQTRCMEGKEEWHRN